MFDLKVITTLKDALLTKQETIAVAESVTAGLLQAALSSAEKAMQIFQGGITTYNLGQKYRHLLVDPIHASACNCVSDKVARQMALQVCELFSSHWGIGITGYATPVPESSNQLFAHYAISHMGKVVHSGKVSALGGEDSEVKLYYTNFVMAECQKAVLDEHNKKGKP